MVISTSNLSWANLELQMGKFGILNLKLGTLERQIWNLRRANLEPSMTKSGTLERQI